MLFKLASDVIAAVSASVVISPIVAMFDRAITKNASGRAKLLPSLVDSLKGFATAPGAFMRSPSFGWLWLVYAATFSAANVSDTSCKSPIPKVVTTTLANTGTGVMKDRAFALRYGQPSAPRALPAACYGFWLSRDALAMGFIFTMPPTVTSTLRAAFASGPPPSDPDERADDDEKWRTRAMLACPIVSQFATTPLHLLGLDVYNRPRGVTPAERGAFLAREMPVTLSARVARIFPAFSVGGVLNAKLRAHMHSAATRLG